MRIPLSFSIAVSVALMYAWAGIESSGENHRSDPPASAKQLRDDVQDGAILDASTSDQPSVRPIRYHKRAASTRPAAASPYYSGKVGVGFTNDIPVAVTLTTIERGRESYARNCQVCHGHPPSVTSADGNAGVPIAALETSPAGYIFARTITEKNTLSPYGPQMTVKDRWAIVAYLKHSLTPRSAQAVP